MTVSDSWDALAETATRRGLPVPEILRPGVSPARLAEAEDELGITLHPDLRDLFERVDGLNRIQGHNHHPSMPGFGFRSLDSVVERTLDLRDIADGEEGGGEMWRPQWVQVFDHLYDEVFAVDCSDGTVWYVWWEADEIYPVAPNLATFLDTAARAAEQDDIRYQLDGDYFETPNGDPWRAPLKKPWTPT